MATSKTAHLPLLDGLKIPVFGLGVWQAECNGETEQACLWAIENGYRMIDTAKDYRFVRDTEKRIIGHIFRNEEEVGTAIKKCGLPRDQIYVTTKVSLLVELMLTI